MKMQSCAVDDLVNWQELRDARLLVSAQDKHHWSIQHLGIPYRMSVTPGIDGRPAPPLGGDTIAILRELGYADLQIARWLGEGVVASYAR